MGYISSTNAVLQEEGLGTQIGLKAVQWKERQIGIENEVKRAYRENWC